MNASQTLLVGSTENFHIVDQEISVLETFWLISSKVFTLDGWSNTAKGYVQNHVHIVDGVRMTVGAEWKICIRHSPSVWVWITLKNASF